MSESRLPSGHPPTEATFSVEAGRFVRGQIRSEIENEAWRRGLTIETRETKALLDSTYYFKVSGESDAVVAYLRAVNRWIKENEA